jgi:hypothetical protein
MPPQSRASVPIALPEIMSTNRLLISETRPRSDADVHRRPQLAPSVGSGFESLLVSEPVGLRPAVRPSLLVHAAGQGQTASVSSTSKDGKIVRHLDIQTRVQAGMARDPKFGCRWQSVANGTAAETARIKRKPLRWVATGCRRRSMVRGSAGSSPPEGSAKTAQNAAFCRTSLREF